METETKNPTSPSSHLEDTITHWLDNYYVENNGIFPADFYDCLIEEIEEAMLQELMAKVRNQSKISRILGLTRGTTRKMLKKYGIIY